MDEVKIEVTGVPATYDEEILKLLFENKQKMGREIQIGDVLFNRNRKAALVTVSPKDASVVLEIGSMTMRETQLHFTRPDDTFWTKSTIRVKNIPPDISQERVELTFESKKIRGRELDVSHVWVDTQKGYTYVTYSHERDVKRVLRTRVSILFDVELIIDGPHYRPVDNAEQTNESLQNEILDT